MEILNAKSIILENINDIFKCYESHKTKYALEIKSLGSKFNELQEFNKKLVNENNEKDKLLIVTEKKMVDYEDMINQIQEQANKELSEKERFTMLKAQDREIHQRDLEIKKLQSEVNKLQEELEFLKRTKEISEKTPELKLVDKMKDIMKDDNNIEEEIEEKNSGGWSPTSSSYPTPTPVIETNDVVEEKNTSDEDMDIEEPEPEPGPGPTDKKFNTPDLPNIEPEPSPDGSIHSDENIEEEKEEEEDEAISVSVIKHYKKEYYTIDGENPQYIYSIEDGDLGEKVGEIHGKKKTLYNKG
jgi:myosin heavy subunit